MKIKAQRLAKLLETKSVKVQELVLNCKPNFKNIQEENLFNEAMYCHRRERGIVKVSRFTFDYKRKFPAALEKHLLKIFTEENEFEYEDDNSCEKYVWWLFTTNNKCDINAKQLLEFPLVNSLPSLAAKNDSASPYLFERVPLWIKAQTVIQKEQKNNLIEMPLLSFGKELYSEGQISFALESAIASFGGAAKQSSANKCAECVVHIDDEENFGNNREFLYLVQMLSASFVGVDEVIFHNVDVNDFKNALMKFNKLTDENLFEFLLGQNYKWQNDVEQTLCRSRKMINNITCMGEESVEVQNLINNFPPNFENERKRKYFIKALAAHKNTSGSINISRWCIEQNLKLQIEIVKNKMEISTEQNFFDYKDCSTNSKKVWYMNYADSNLFGYYGSDLFAQDEIQTLEHPLLGSIVEYLDKSKIKNLCSKTVQENIPTPYVFENVPYWIEVNTAPTLTNGKKANLYGRNFSDLPEDVVDCGIKIVQGEKQNNIIAMAAPSNGKGLYTKLELENLLETVLAAFTGAVDKSKEKECVIHTGSWGCGAFGNNKELMYLSQMIGASSAGCKKLLFHKVEEVDFKNAESKFEMIKEKMSFNEAVEFLLNQKFVWNRN